MSSFGAQTTALEVGGVRQVVADYVTLTKPRVQLLLLLTTVTTMYVAGDPSVELVLATCLGGSPATYIVVTVVSSSSSWTRGLVSAT